MFLEPDALMKEVAEASSEFDAFDFPGMPIHRKKELAAFLMLQDQEFPLVMFESGFSERENLSHKRRPIMA